MLVVMMGMSMLIHSEQGLVAGLKIINANDALMAQGRNMFADDPLPDTGVINQVQDVVEAIAATDLPPLEWLERLESERLMTREMVVRIRPWENLTERQKHLFAVQGITVIPWSDGESVPKRWDELSSVGHFWIEPTDVGPRAKRAWMIHGVMANMMASQRSRGHTITDLDVLRIILWSDDLVQQQEWVANNPPPDMPDEVVPARVTVKIIPSTVGVLIMFWTTVGFVVLMASIGTMLFALSGWDALRREGVFEPLMGLAFDARWLVVGHLWYWTVVLAAMILSAGVVAGVVLSFYQIPMFWGDMLKMVLLCVVGGALIAHFSVLVSVWIAKRWWRIWVTSIMTAASLGLQLSYVSMFSRTSDLAMLMTGASYWAILFVGIALVFAMTQMIAWRMERTQRLGFRRY